MARCYLPNERASSNMRNLARILHMCPRAVGCVTRRPVVVVVVAGREQQLPASQPASTTNAIDGLCNPIKRNYHPNIWSTSVRCVRLAPASIVRWEISAPPSWLWFDWNPTLSKIACGGQKRQKRRSKCHKSTRLRTSKTIESRWLAGETLQSEPAE